MPPATLLAGTQVIGNCREQSPTLLPVGRRSRTSMCSTTTLRPAGRRSRASLRSTAYLHPVDKKIAPLGAIISVFSFGIT